MTTPAGLDDFCRREYPRLTRMLDAYLGDVMVAEELALLIRNSKDVDHLMGLLEVQVV